MLLLAFLRKTHQCRTQCQNVPYTLMSIISRRKLTFFGQLSDGLLNTYATDDIIAEADADFITFGKPSNVNSNDSLQVLWTRPLNVAQFMTSADEKNI